MTVSAYLREVPTGRRAALSRLRALAKKTAPNAVESMQYGMPTYTVGDRFFAFASQRQYIALYFCDTDLLERYRGRLGKLDCGKSCLRVRRPGDIPFDLRSGMLQELWPRSGGRV